MSEYTESIRNLVGMAALMQGSGRDGFEEFDRWLASVKAEAWAEGLAEGAYRGPENLLFATNPYREEPK